MTDSMFVFDKKINVSSPYGEMYTRSERVPADILSRFLAFAFDAFLVFILLMFIEIFLGYFVMQALWHTSVPTPDRLIAGHLSYWGIPAQIIAFIYYSYFYLLYSASPGKMVFNLRVVDVRSSGDLSLFQIFLREIVGKFYSSIFLGLGYFLVFFRKDRRSLHDLIAGSMVTRETPY